jgi:transposase
MPEIVGGFDIHRKQLTFDYLDTASGQVACGQITPADRGHLRSWLARLENPQDAAFAAGACTGWRYVTGELARAGAQAHLAEPADTAAARGRKRRAKTDRTDARLLRDLLAEGRLPECWIPPPHIVECRALLECYHDLRTEHTAWVQRIHATLFQAQIAVCLRVLAVLEAELTAVRHRLLTTAAHLRGASALTGALYGAGPVTGLALTCWPGGAGRFSSARKAVRFAGLDITVYSSDGKRSPGHLSCQGPPVLRWCACEVSAHATAPGHHYYAAVKDRHDGKRAALAEARKIIRRACHILTEPGDDAFTTV